MVEDLGFVFTKDRATEIVANNLGNKNVLNWILNRVGEIGGIIESTEVPDHSVELIKKLGIKILDSGSFFVERTKQSLLSSGKNFEAINFPSTLSNKNKIEIISYIEERIDQRFKRLDLCSGNLDGLEGMWPYELMKSMSLDDENVLSLFSLTDSIGKKATASIRDFCKIKGFGFLAKIAILKRVVGSLNPSIEILARDLIHITGSSDISESRVINKIDLTSLASIEDEALSDVFFLRNKDKKHILSFIKSLNGKEPRYLRDISEMINSVKAGVTAIEERIMSLESEEEKAVLIEAKNRIEVRLDEVISVDNAENVHDGLVPILSFIKSDPLQPLGQDKFKKLEISKKSEENLGFRLFFPKTREDLIYLGDANGWCVNYHRHYGDGVVSKGNILVGICERGLEPNRENVIALAHFVNEGRGSYTLEQLKWSSRKKNGARNVDATSAFDHHKILDEITSFIKKEDKRYS